MAQPKLSSRQQAQLAFLQTVPKRFERVHVVLERMAALQADEAQVRGLGRLLDEMKAHAAGLGLAALADTAGLMSTLSRRGGGMQMKVRGLRELYGSLKINYEGALKSASTPDPAEEAGSGVERS